MDLQVVRHGETDYNLQGRYAGSTDIPLNATGFQQAEQLANQLSKTHFDKIISSPMLRARQTADVIQKKLQSPLVIFAQFAERNIGVYEGLTRDEAMQRYPELWKRQCTRQLDDAPTNGETLRQVLARVHGAMDQLKRAYPEERLLLVCHGFISKAINQYCTGVDFEEMHRFSLGNCEVAVYLL